MRVTLVQPPSNRVDTSELAPPLSLLTVAAVLREDDVDVTIVDLNMECLHNHDNAGPNFYHWATARIVSTAPDLVGFTSMALESHVCLEIARLLKEQDSSVRIVLGGPHFSAIARDVLNIYSWVDFIVLGEGETAARGLVRALRQNKPLSTTPNLAYLDGGEFRLERVLKPNTSFNDYPFPAYDLVDLDAYYALNPYRVHDIEQSRGCVLRCAFCYAANHWGQGEQARSIDRVVEDVNRHYALGARHLSFVGDNFLNSKPYAKAVADGIAGGNPGVTWRCYGTLPQLTEDIVESFTRAGCRYVFVGIDAVSKRAKKRLQKSYFRGWPSLRRSLDRCLHRGLTPTCAFLLHPSSSFEAESDSEEALMIATHVHQLRCGVRLNPITVYTGTGLAPTTEENPMRYSNAKPRILFDGHWVTEHNPYAQERPYLYPYHSTVGPPESYESFIRATHVGHTLLDHFSCTLMQAIHADKSLWSLLKEAAAHVDFSEGAGATWKDQEVEAFVDIVNSRPATTEMRDTLAFELAEYRLRRQPSPLPVSVVIEGMKLEIQLMPHAQLRLSRSPCAYDTTEPPAELDNTLKQSYLIVPNGVGMRYLQSTRAVEHLLSKLNASRFEDRPISAPAEGIASLVSANVITLPGTLECVQAGVQT